MTEQEGAAGGADLFQAMPFGQIVAMLETLDEPPSLGTIDLAELVGRFPELASVAVRDVAIDGPHGDVPGRVYRRPDATGATGAGLVWVHGGAFIGGDLDMPEAHWVSLALAARGTTVVSLDYRKALRGVHYPMPSDDVLAGWCWTAAHADELGIDPGRLHLGGASAGGNLAAGVTKRLRDGAGPLPVSLVMVYPVVHAVLPPLSAELEATLAADEATTTAATDTFRDMARQYAGSDAALDDPYAFAASGDVAGQPPVLVLDSETDFLRASGEAYAQALAAAGVAVTVVTEPGTSHGHVNGPDMPGALASIERLATWIEEQR